MQKQTNGNPTNFVAQNRPAKSEKQRLVRRIARMVRQAGLDYDGWRYVSRRVRQNCELKPARKPKRLPQIPTDAELRRFLQVVDQADDAQHSLMVRFALVTGLRVSELCRVEVGHVDLDRQTVFVKSGKGSKDRVALFTESLAVALRSHLAAFRPAGAANSPRGGSSRSSRATLLAPM